MSGDDLPASADQKRPATHRNRWARLAAPAGCLLSAMLGAYMWTVWLRWPCGRLRPTRDGLECQSSAELSPKCLTLHSVLVLLARVPHGPTSLTRSNEIQIVRTESPMKVR